MSSRDKRLGQTLRARETECITGVRILAGTSPATTKPTATDAYSDTNGDIEVGAGCKFAASNGAPAMSEKMAGCEEQRRTMVPISSGAPVFFTP
jgi:hypothetical protein